jgi:hypothetical protein
VLGSTWTPCAQPLEQENWLDDQARVVAFVEVESALEHDDRRSREIAEEQATDVPRRRRGRPARKVRERDRDRVLEVVGKSTEPRAEDDPDRRHEVGLRPDRPLKSVESRGLLSRRDRAAMVDRAIG